MFCGYLKFLHGFRWTLAYVVSLISYHLLIRQKFDPIWSKISVVSDHLSLTFLGCSLTGGSTVIVTK